MIPSNKEKAKRFRLGNAVFKWLIFGWSQNHAAGGGRTKLVKTGRNITELSSTTRAAAITVSIGNELTKAMAGAAFGAEQIEQEWPAVSEPTGWE